MGYLTVGSVYSTWHVQNYLPLTKEKSKYIIQSWCMLLIKDTDGVSGITCSSARTARCTKCGGTVWRMRMLQSALGYETCFPSTLRNSEIYLVFRVHDKARDGSRYVSL